MNWLTLTVLGAVAAWFEYSYQRSRRKKVSDSRCPDPVAAVVPETANVEDPREAPSIAPGAENDQKLNSAM